MGRNRPGYYPIMLDVADKRILVVGGGPIAERKTLGLLEAGARVAIASPRLTDRLARLAADGVVETAKREYRIEDLQGAALVFAAASSRETNERVARDAAAAGIWCNVADRAEEGDFLAPSVVRRGDLLLAVTASGASPALAARIASELSSDYGETYADYTAWLRRLRETALALVDDAAERRRVLRAALDVPEQQWRSDKDGPAIEARIAALRRQMAQPAGRDERLNDDMNGMSGG